MRTVTDVLRARSEAILEDARTLFTQHSVIHANPPQDPYSGLIVIHAGSHYWGNLPVEGQRVASKLRDKYERFADVLCVLFRNQDNRTLQELQISRTWLRRWIDQSGAHSFRNGQAAIDGFTKEINKQLGWLEKLYDGREGEHIYVPDTNALIYHPKLEEWRFDESPQFTLVLTPTVLGELDKLKVNDRNPAVREKAQRVINQVKEYRRRGNPVEGVTIRKGKIGLQTVAVEPDFEKTLPWLDKDNADDRILAGFVEVMRQHPRCPVLLVTGDINLMNKADFAGLPSVEPPECSDKAT